MTATSTHDAEREDECRRINGERQDDDEILADN